MSSSLTSRFLLSRRSDVSANGRAPRRGGVSVGKVESQRLEENQEGGRGINRRAASTDASGVTKCDDLASRSKIRSKSTNCQETTCQKVNYQKTNRQKRVVEVNRTVAANSGSAESHAVGSQVRGAVTNALNARSENNLKLVSSGNDSRELVVLRSPDCEKKVSQARSVSRGKEMAGKRLPVPTPNPKTLPKGSTKSRPVDLPAQIKNSNSNVGTKAIIPRRRGDADLPGLTASARRSSLVPDVSDVHFAWYKEYDLKKLYPISPLLCIQESFAWLAAAAVLTAIHLFVFGPSFFGFVEDPVQHISSLSVRGSIIAAMVAVVYHYLLEQTKELKMNGFRLILAKGIFRRLHGSMTLGAIGQIYIKQKPIDMIFNLYRVQILVPMTPDNSLSLFRGLTREQAYHLQSFLAREMNRQVFVSGDAIKAEEEIQTMAAMQEAREDLDGDDGSHQPRRSSIARKAQGNKASIRPNRSQPNRA